MCNVQKSLDLKNHITLRVEIKYVEVCSLMANFPGFPGRSQILQMPINPLNFLSFPATHKYICKKNIQAHTYIFESLTIK